MSPPVILVTGGAGGLGVAICTGLAQAGFRLAVGYRTSRAAAADLATSLPGTGHQAFAFDVTDTAALPAAVAALEQKMGGCDALVNGAGTTRFVAHADLNGLDDALINDILTTNIRGPFAAVRALHPLLARSNLPGGGVVINISSIAARSGNGSNIMYCASKAALDNMTLSLARALAPQIRVLSVSPGLVDTQFVKSLDQSWRDAQVAHTPLGRLAAPEEIAAAVLAAIRDLRFSTGCIIPVDGGRPLK
jgi:3-oxoacyl-[acyl-carrier protein] reductase